jgi:hypothetical protein
MRKLLIVLGILVLPISTMAGTSILNWNEPGASGTTWPGYTWYRSSDADGTGKYGANAEVQVQAHHGWRNNAGRYQSGGATNWQQRFMGKDDHSNSGGDGCLVGLYTETEATIVTNDRAPSTLTGAALRFGQDADSTCYDASWWVNWMSNFRNLGFTTQSTNRLELYAKFEGYPHIDFTSTTLGSTGRVHFGTYLCLTGDCYDDFRDGESGYGGVDVQGWHFYHYLTVNPGAWVKISLDDHPNHMRGATYLAGNEPGVNPTAAYGGNYWELFNHGYFEIRYPQNNTAPAYVTTDEWELVDVTEPENVESITSLWVGRWPTGRWEIGWQEASWNQVGYNSTTQSTFEVRYSTSPITNANFSTATIINPLFNVYGGNKVRRPNSWSTPAWTAFTLLPQIETAQKIYFAVKDVSLGANGDGHDSPSSLIHTISYDLAPSGVQADTTPPTCSAFAFTPTSTSLTVQIATPISCTDNVGVTGHVLSESPNPPSAGATGVMPAPTAFTFGGVGFRTAYHYARDAAGNWSLVRSSSTTITEPQTPVGGGGTVMGIRGRSIVSPTGQGRMIFQP